MCNKYMFFCGMSGAREGSGRLDCLVFADRAEPPNPLSVAKAKEY